MSPQSKVPTFYIVAVVLDGAASHRDLLCRVLEIRSGRGIYFFKDD